MTKLRSEWINFYRGMTYFFYKYWYFFLFWIVPSLFLNWLTRDSISWKVGNLDKLIDYLPLVMLIGSKLLVSFSLVALLKFSYTTTNLSMKSSTSYAYCTTSSTLSFFAPFTLLSGYNFSCYNEFLKDSKPFLLSRKKIPCWWRKWSSFFITVEKTNSIILVFEINNLSLYSR